MQLEIDAAYRAKYQLVEAITHLAFSAGWPNAMTAITTAKRVFGNAEG